MSRERFELIVEKAMDGWSSFFLQAFFGLEANGISGDYVEFGSLSGTTLWLAFEQIEASSVDRHCWAFDSFQGLPETTEPRDEHPAFMRGRGGGGVAEFHEMLAGHGVPREAYTTVEGFYEDTLPPLGDDGPPVDIALAYVDCNLFSSTVTALEFLRPRLKHGMILAFDDWFCWSSTRVSGERAALQEFVAANPQWHFERWKDVNWGGLSFVVLHADQVTRPDL